jgi:hypothetical protein
VNNLFVTGAGVSEQDRDASVVLAVDGTPILKASQGWDLARAQSQKRKSTSRHPRRKRVKSKYSSLYNGYQLTLQLG